MKTAAFKTKTENLEGEVVLRLPTFDEKYSFLDTLDVDLDAEEEAEEQVKSKSKKDTLKMVRNMVKASLKHYEKVDIKNVVTGEVFKSVDDLQYGDGHLVLIEMAGKLFHGSGSTVGNEEKSQ